MTADALYPEPAPPRRELREPHNLPEPARGRGLEHFARIRRWEIRALGLVPKSEIVAVTAKIKKKIAARGITLRVARQVVERWDYQRRSHRRERSVERYKQIEGKWYMVAIYIPDQKDRHPHNSLASVYQRNAKEVEEWIADGKLQRRKEEK
jgi:hypothetical protein